MLTVVGPEAPLADGIVDIFRKRGLNIFGPSRDVAQLESSKTFAKRFMQRHNIPSAKFADFTDVTSAHIYLDKQQAPVVVKADGLAAGKGVFVAQTLADAHSAVDTIFSTALGNRQGKRKRLLIEQYLPGEEVSFIVIADGKTALPLATSQDHKRLLNDDLGPNTGGMGAYSPAPIITPELHAKIMRQVINPTLSGMAAEGLSYSGFLYAGLMVKPDGEIAVLEYNCRLGDPETQPILMRLKTDLLTIIEAAMEERLHEMEVEWDRRIALGVVMAAPGYPVKPELGGEIAGLPDNNQQADDLRVFHAGTSQNDGSIVTSGGRVLCVTALGETVKHAQSRAYSLVKQINFTGAQYRSDIGFRAI